jgi:hypothetical protein
MVFYSTACLMGPIWTCASATMSFPLSVGGVLNQFHCLSLIMSSSEPRARRLSALGRRFALPKSYLVIGSVRFSTASGGPPPGTMAVAGPSCTSI